MKNIRLLVTLIAILSVFLVSCGDNSTDELIEQIFEIEDIQSYWVWPGFSATFNGAIDCAIEYYEEYRETYPELIELEGKKDAVKKLLDFADKCLNINTEDQYGKGHSALLILDREVFRDQMSIFQRIKYEKLCMKSSSYRHMEWYREKHPEEYAF